MMSRSVLTGKHLDNQLTKYFDSILKGWSVIRTPKKNKDLKISGIVLSPDGGNNALGLAIGKNYNTIICLDNIDLYNINKGIIETVYKQDIYIYSLGIDWITNTNIGNELIANIFNFLNPGYWKNVEGRNQLMISQGSKLDLGKILARFKGAIKWIHPIMLSDDNPLLCESILLVLDDIKYDLIQAYSPSVIIVTSLDSHLIDYCMFNKIPLVWIHKNDILNELVRELQYILNPLFYPVKILPLISNQRLPMLNLNGLNGI